MFPKVTVFLVRISLDGQREFGTKNIVTLKDIDLFWLIWMAQASYYTQIGLWILSPIIYTESGLWRDLLMAKMNRRNDYSKTNMHECSFRHLTIVLGQTCIIVNLSFRVFFFFNLLNQSKGRVLYVVGNVKHSETIL